MCALRIRPITKRSNVLCQLRKPATIKSRKEFRTKYAGIQIRLLAFWDKTDNKKTLVVATHGFIKKVDKVPSYEIDRALRLKYNYFKNKERK